MDIEQIINILISGGILAFPTDTVFGMGCLMNEKAIEKIYEAKHRDFNKSLPMMCNSIEMVEKYAYVSEDAAKVIKAFTPGALTFVLKKKESVDKCFTNGKDTIAIRIPDDKWIMDLIERIGEPLMVTSANISNEGSLLKYEDVYKSMNTRIDAIVCEDARGDKASTIVDLCDEIKILREGPISFEEILEVIR